jgi:hypothetical protein
MKQLIVGIISAEPVAVATAIEATALAVAAIAGVISTETALAVSAALAAIHVVLRQAVFSPKTVAEDYVEV